MRCGAQTVLFVLFDIPIQTLWGAWESQSSPLVHCTCPFRWREHQARFKKNLTVYDMSNEQRQAEVDKLKAQAAILVKCERWPEAQERYHDCR